MKQEDIDRGKEILVELFHLTVKAHRIACEGQVPEEVILTGEIMRDVSALKDKALRLNGMLGGVIVKSGGT